MRYVSEALAEEQLIEKPCRRIFASELVASTFRAITGHRTEGATSAVCSWETGYCPADV